MGASLLGRLLTAQKKKNAPRRKGTRSTFLDQAVESNDAFTTRRERGNTSEPRDAGESTGKSSLFFLTVTKSTSNRRQEAPPNRVGRRRGATTGKASRYQRRPDGFRRPLKIEARQRERGEHGFGHVSSRPDHFPACPYPSPQQVSKVNSLWSMKQCGSGKSAK